MHNQLSLSSMTQRPAGNRSKLTDSMILETILRLSPFFTGNRTKFQRWPQAALHLLKCSRKKTSTRVVSTEGPLSTMLYCSCELFPSTPLATPLCSLTHAHCLRFRRLHPWISHRRRRLLGRASYKSPPHLALYPLGTLRSCSFRAVSSSLLTHSLNISELL